MKKLSIPTNAFFTSPNEFKSELLEELKLKKVILFISESSSKRLDLVDWIKELRSVCSLIHINEINSNPTYKDIYKSLLQLKGTNPTIVLAIGGGSSMDMAKATVGLYYLTQDKNFNETDVLNSIKNKEFLNYSNDIKIYAVPTTAGTGSEVTRWATVWDMKDGAKYSVDSPYLYPKKAFIIPEFTLLMPKRLTLSTGLDALCQAVEAYWAKTTNPMVKELSKSAIKLIVEYLPKVLNEPNNLYYRKKMFLGSLFSGLAFSNTRTTACHSISYPLTMKFGVEHGLACIITLPQVLELNKAEIEELEELYEALNVNSSHELDLWLNKITNNIVELKLSSFGIKQSDLEELANMSLTLGRMDNNPVKIDKNDVEVILKKIF